MMNQVFPSLLPGIRTLKCLKYTNNKYRVIIEMEGKRVYSRQYSEKEHKTIANKYISRYGIANMLHLGEIHVEIVPTQRLFIEDKVILVVTWPVKQ